MHVLSGTSGFSYDEWHGRFYPADLPAGERLAHYSARLPSVEINNTFYQTPKAPMLERWRAAVPSEFRFALKAPRRITHIQRLKGSEGALAYFLSAASTLGETLGPVLFQLPPFAKKDVVLLSDFLALLPAGVRAAFEFRNASWFDDEIYALLSARGAALCAGDAEDGDRSPPLVATTDFGYLRLRAPSYDAAGLHAWRERIAAQNWERAYVYLKHEVLGPDYAGYLSALTRGEEPPFPPPLDSSATPVAVKSGRYARKQPSPTEPVAAPKPPRATKQAAPKVPRVAQQAAPKAPRVTKTKPAPAAVKPRAKASAKRR